MGRRGTGHVHQQWTAAAKVRVALIERLPIGRGPIIGGRSAEDCAGLKANHRFAATPSRGITGVTCGNEWVLPITGHAANCPYGATDGIGGPGCYAGWIID